MAKELQLEAYCLKCKEKRIMVDPQPEWASNGTPATRGSCPVCGTTMYKRGMTPLHENLPKPEITATRRKKSGSRKKKSKASAKKDNGQKSVSRRGTLVIVESPAKAKTIGKYLGRGFTVKSSIGHVRDLLKSRLSVDIDNNYEPEYRVPNEKRPLIKELKAAAAKAKEIYLATDPDREGEAIAWHVMESAEMEPERTRRVVFQEITKPAVQAAFEHPREIDMQRVDAQQARRILDRLVGYKLSPLLWRKVRGNLSAGRVQSVAVRLVVEREREIEAFETEEYWTVDASLSQQIYAGEKARPEQGRGGAIARRQGQAEVADLPAVALAHVFRHHVVEMDEDTVAETGAGGGQMGRIDRRAALDADRLGVVDAKIKADEDGVGVAGVDKEMLAALGDQLAVAGTHGRHLLAGAGEAAPRQADQRFVGVTVGLPAARAARRHRQQVGERRAHLPHAGEQAHVEGAGAIAGAGRAHGIDVDQGMF